MTGLLEYVQLFDHDQDGRKDIEDNCPPEEGADPSMSANPDQADLDDDGIGDLCDICKGDSNNDIDGDHVCAGLVVEAGVHPDVCPEVSDPDQLDTDQDGKGAACERCDNDPFDDFDQDGVCGDVDVCPELADAGQEDRDGDTFGDACEVCPDDPLNDEDRDFLCADADSCPADANTFVDADQDGKDAACDTCENDPMNDADQDGVCGDVDNCPSAANPDQANTYGDVRGDACEPRPPTPTPTASETPTPTMPTEEPTMTAIPTPFPTPSTTMDTPTPLITKT